MRRLSFAIAVLLAVAWTCGAAAWAGRMSGPAGPTSAPPAAAPGSSSSVRGIVQSVSPDELVVRTLDGSTVTFAVDATARIRVNNKPASIAAIHQGFVVVVTQRGQAPLTIDAYGPTLARAHVRPLVGTIRTLTADSMVLAAAGRSSVTFAVDPGSRIFVDGKTSSGDRLAAGDVAVVRPAAGVARTAYEVDAFSGGRLYGGTIVSVTPTKLGVRVRPGRVLRFRVASLGRIYLNDSAAGTARLHAGLVVVVRTAPRHELWAFGAG